MLSILPVCLLGIVMIWFVWPIVADPINRRLSMRATSDIDPLGDDLFRAIAKHSGPDRDLNRVLRG